MLKVVWSTLQGGRIKESNATCDEICVAPVGDFWLYTNGVRTHTINSMDNPWLSLRVGEVKPESEHDPGCNKDHHPDAYCNPEAPDRERHTRRVTPYGPDYCAECSEGVKDYVQWPCPGIEAIRTGE